jgi:hypothetical protein
MSSVRSPSPGRGDSPRATTIDLIGFPMDLGSLAGVATHYRRCGR